MSLQRSSFQNAGIAIAKVLSMTIGGSSYDDTFRRDSSGARDFEDELPFLPVTYILWIIFVILMPLLLNNLLVCSCLPKMFFFFFCDRRLVKNSCILIYSIYTS